MEVSLLIKLNFALLPDDLCEIQEISQPTEQALLAYLKKAHAEEKSEFATSVEAILAEDMDADGDKSVSYDVESETPNKSRFLKKRRFASTKDHGDERIEELLEEARDRGSKQNSIGKDV